MTASRARLVLILLLILNPWPALAQPSGEQGVIQPFLRNMTRASAWSFFDPPPGGGDPTYADVANRLQLGLERRGGRVEATAALQYVQFGGLPANAFGPGPLGVGALYFDHNGRTDSRQAYLRYLNARVRVPGGVSIRGGRFGYTSGAESASGVPKIEAVKRQRVDSRLIGEFEWALYQRSYDGVRIDIDRRAWQVTGTAMRPTQGGFEEEAGARIDDIAVLAAALTMRPGGVLPRTEWQVFAYRYGDSRPVTGRPDNTGRTAAAVDIRVNTVGTTLVGAYPTAAGEVDLVLWVAGQNGAWYGQSHRGLSYAAEAGHEWSRVAWHPWLRIGLLHASGDPDPGDNRHQTFFQILPTVRRYSLSATYSQMNLDDRFVQAWLRPHASMTVRLDVHRLSLAKGADGWYAGSGATQRAGRIFGYAVRPSGGRSSLGTVLEGSVDWRFNRYWSVNGYTGRFLGGAVVRTSFAGDRLTFAYVENVLQF